MNGDNDKKGPNYLVLVIILLIFIITLGILVYYIRFKTTITPKASSYSTLNAVSISNSYVFASPVRATAKGDLIRVTVFVLDGEGNGLYDKKVILKSNNQNLIIKEVQSLTDETGKALFDISSEVVNTYDLEAYVDDIVLPQSLKVVFD